ncbi:DMT family transporter [Candidatus Woesearchaeota archaeon]|nr:DMT family transporter [Candidatus Woesearchaeota archaeon]
MKESLKGALYIVSAMLIFAFFGIFLRFLNLPSLVVVFFYFMLTGVFMFIFFFFKNKSIIIVKSHWHLIILLALFNIGNNFFYFQSFSRTTISNAVVTHYTAPIFVAILAPFLLKEKMDRATLYALGISIIGLLFITYNDLSFGSSHIAGIAYGIASGLMYGLVIIIVKHLSGKLSSFSIITYMCLLGGFILSPFAFAADVNYGPRLIFMLALFAVLFGVIATSFHFAGIKRVKSQHAGILAYAELVAAPIYGLIFFNEIPALSTIIGGIMIFIAGYLIMKDPVNLRRHFARRFF